MAAIRRQVSVEGAAVALAGDLTVPDDPSGLVLFAHGSGSSRHSPRNQAVAVSLNDAGLGTLLFDLLTADEEAVDARTGELRFDIALLARRLTMALDWLDDDGAPAARLPCGLFGASTGAAAALAAAGQRPGRVRAVVSRGGRPDLAAPLLAGVRAPVLLIVGGADTRVRELNEAVLADLPGGSDLAVVPGAGHLFAEPGALDQVATLATAWFTRHVTASGQAAGA
jgi:pimeloyl-ACP methyl ester carboxylesterase